MSRTSYIFNILSLPPEILKRIATYLDMNSRLKFGWTCKYFELITRFPSLWFNFQWITNGRRRNFLSMEHALRRNGENVRKLSLTGSFDRNNRVFPLRLPHPICCCIYLQSLTLTNFHFDSRDLSPLLTLPRLTELHLHSINSTMIKLPPLRRRKNLKILSVYKKHDFKTWAESEYFPADVRVILPDRLKKKKHSQAKYLDKDVIDNHHKPANTIFQNAACLTFYQPLLKYVSLTHVPIAQIHFTPPNMVPTVKRFTRYRGMYNLAIIEDGFGSKVVSGAASFPHLLFREATMVAPSTDITSITLYKETNFTGKNLQTIAFVCPNLIHLDISFSDQCLLNLNGLRGVASSCTKLESLYMDAEDDRRLINHDALWGVIRTMNNLKVLKVSIHLIPPTLGANYLPSLLALFLLYSFKLSPYRFNDTYFDFFNNLPSLRYFRLNSIPPETVNIGLYNCLNTFTYLTHLYIHKYDGGKLTLPLIATCYRNLEKLYLCCEDFLLRGELATTISRCKKLKILALKVNYMSLDSISTMFYSLPRLFIFYIHTRGPLSPGNRQVIDDLIQCFEEHAESQKREINLEIVEQSTVEFFTQTDEDIFNK